MWRLHALNPPAFLIDEHRSISSADALPEIGDQVRDLVAGVAIALKEDQSPGIGGFKKIALLARQCRGLASRNERFRCHVGRWLCCVLAAVAHDAISLAGCNERVAQLRCLGPRFDRANTQPVIGSPVTKVRLLDQR